MSREVAADKELCHELDTRSKWEVQWSHWPQIMSRAFLQLVIISHTDY